MGSRAQVSADDPMTNLASLLHVVIPARPTSPPAVVVRAPTSTSSSPKQVRLLAWCVYECVGLLTGVPVVARIARFRASVGHARLQHHQPALPAVGPVRGK